MPALAPTGQTARVVWLGRVEDRGAGILSQPCDHLELGFEGVPGEAHAGLLRPADERVAAQHPPGTPIRNSRQLTLVSREDLEAIAAEMGLDEVLPGWLGATVMVEGLPDFTLLPPSSRLQGPSGATLVVDMENHPCNLPAREIEARHPGLGARFRSAARHRRGVTAWVEREGVLALGDALALHAPTQPPWPGGA